MGQKTILIIATGFGLGRIPFAPGTFGTLAGLPLIGLMVWLATAGTPGAAALFLVGVILCAVWISQEAEILIGGKDPGAIVIDEMAGFCVTMTLVPVTVLTLAAGFIAFRCFDILKPFPIRWFEKTFSGGAGIVLDDIMAGLLAAFLLKAIYLSATI
ncbi:phosphatidylglycerophosphatase A [Desulfobacter hydrogenophilus]|uniref:Phosphatidylglycerophosphatase A n=1 Tax=Desulfobacter hydrogenophilus TaxID=2291 RepID=A0A328FID2_9BACT|nr:phosphatidylglycerophosphatase A [Desulfobacter hydrogenophilus]NDY71211.1 phosphatidylglycerophosphatase A [Desulfobacter hydrogenophilus]QBH15048.1 phosphatidylglycerophosphatase A [Desulfobacter hydrogenophilus]RAM02705.1 phosphatidylglycerophosphatase A [Desulfobacter hydrogenophilus]